LNSPSGRTNVNGNAPCSSAHQESVRATPVSAVPDSAIHVVRVFFKKIAMTSVMGTALETMGIRSEGLLAVSAVATMPK
jgi:hypothetical protein